MSVWREIWLTRATLWPLAAVVPLLAALVWVRRTNYWPYARRHLVLNLLADTPRRAAARLCARLRHVRPARPDAGGVIGLIQYNGDRAIGQTATNLENLGRLAGRAVAGGARLIVLPEGAIHGYGDETRNYWCTGRPRRLRIRDVEVDCRNVDEVAEELPGGPAERFWSDFARRHGVMVLFDLIERDGEDYFNTLAAVDAGGLCARHRKVCLTPEEQPYATPGDEATVLETPVGRFGLMICNDSWIGHDLFRAYADAGVDGLIVSTYWHRFQPHDARRSERRHFALIALEHRLPVYVADNSFSDRTGLYPAGSLRGPLRRGLPRHAVDVDGVSLHPVARRA